MNELRQNVQNCLVYLVGCKCPPPSFLSFSLPSLCSLNVVDMVESGEKHRAISLEDVKAFAATVGVRGVFETSARTGKVLLFSPSLLLLSPSPLIPSTQGIEDLFHRIASDWLHANPASSQSPLGSSSRTLTAEQQQQQQQQGDQCSC